MSEWEEFIKTAGQYYVAGRYSAFAGFIPTTGNLFHHAIEMFLKGGLSKTGITLADLKKLSHDLPKIWETFKRTFKDQSLDRFDHVIASLHRFEDIRYPDLIVQKGMNAKIEILAPARPPGPQSGSEPVYELYLQHIDELVGQIFKTASANPRAFLSNRFHKQEAKQFLMEQNTVSTLTK
jgi:hypothetical protein